MRTGTPPQADEGGNKKGERYQEGRTLSGLKQRLSISSGDHAFEPRMPTKQPAEVNSREGQKDCTQDEGRYRDHLFSTIFNEAPL